MEDLIGRNTMLARFLAVPGWVFILAGLFVTAVCLAPFVYLYVFWEIREDHLPNETWMLVSPFIAIAGAFVGSMIGLLALVKFKLKHIFKIAQVKRRDT